MTRAILILPLLLAACSMPEANPPSLGPRPIEGVLNEPSYAIAPVKSADDPALASRIAELVTQAESGEEDFRALLPGVRNAVGAAAGAFVESERWIQAQLLLSALNGARSQTTTSLGSLDDIYGGQAVAGEPAETEALLAARERVSTLAETQAEDYETLAAQLSSR